MRTILLLTFSAAALLQAEDYPLGPDSEPQPGVPKGTVTRLILPPGKFYPGTPHNYAIYVPAQYDSAKPAPVMIYLDGGGALGNGQRVPTVLDNLIAKKELPPMIGVFVDPGVLPALNDSAQSRFERVFEYDSLSDRFSHFLLEELLPEVAKKYNLSLDPNDRGIAGVSTGAVGAFMAAWNRPDRFRRVLSFIGTFVAMKGADSLPALIRKTEPKPLRVFLQAGRNDHIGADEPYGTFFAGSWPMNNRVMYEALQSAGYDAKLVIGEEGHNMKQGAAIMPEALRWLWRDYPKPITPTGPAVMSDPRGKVLSTISLDKPWQQVGESYGTIHAAAAGKEGDVYFAGIQIYRADASGAVTVFKNQPAQGIAVGADGRVYVSQPDKKRIAVFNGGSEKVLAQNVEAAGIAVNAKGEVYYADTAHKTIGRIDANGKAQAVLSGAQFATPSGLGLSPDQAMLIVTDSIGRFSWSFQIAADGSLVNGEPFFRLELPENGWKSGINAAMEDSIGQVYFATAIGIQICEANGRMAQILTAPAYGAVTALAFGGKDLDWMYAAEAGKLYRRPLKVHGVAIATPTKPPRPPL